MGIGRAAGQQLGQQVQRPSKAMMRPKNAPKNYKKRVRKQPTQGGVGGMKDWLAGGGKQNWMDEAGISRADQMVGNYQRPDSLNDAPVSQTEANNGGGKPQGQMAGIAPGEYSGPSGGIKSKGGRRPSPGGGQRPTTRPTKGGQRPTGAPNKGAQTAAPMTKKANYSMKRGGKPNFRDLGSDSPARKNENESGYSKQAENLLKAVPNKEAYDNLSEPNKKGFNKAAKEHGLPTKTLSFKMKRGNKPNFKDLGSSKRT